VTIFFEKVKATIADILQHSGNIDNVFFVEYIIKEYPVG